MKIFLIEDNGPNWNMLNQRLSRDWNQVVITIAKGVLLRKIPCEASGLIPINLSRPGKNASKMFYWLIADWKTGAASHAW